MPIVAFFNNVLFSMMLLQLNYGKANIFGKRNTSQNTKLKIEVQQKKIDGAKTALGKTL